MKQKYGSVPTSHLSLLVNWSTSLLLQKGNIPAENCLLVQEIGTEEVFVYKREKHEGM